MLSPESDSGDFKVASGYCGESRTVRGEQVPAMGVFTVAALDLQSDPTEGTQLLHPLSEQNSPHWLS